MNFIKRTIIPGLIFGPLVCTGQIYQAGQPPQSVSNTPAVWDISLGVHRSYMKVIDPAQETLFNKEQGFSARGLYAFSSWLAAGLEGGISERENFPTQNTYRHIYYGGVTKWILTPQTKPRVYLLLGGGIDRRKLSYAGNWAHTVSKPYLTAGTGVELDISSRIYVGLEGQARYNTARTLDAFTALNRRWETVLGVRGGVRF